MATYYKYEKYQKYVNGVPQDEYKRGNLIGTGEYSSLQDCEEGAIYKWIDSGETICDGYKLCVKEIKQKSTDGGNTWVTTSETRAGTVIDMWSRECGVEPLHRWEPTGKTICKDYSKEEEYVYQVSYTMGTTWEDVEPRETKWELTDAFTDECFLAAEPFTFDAGEEGGQLALNTTISTLYSYSAPDGPYREYTSNRDYYYIMYWHARAIAKYAIDWGEGEEVQIQTVTKADIAEESYASNKPVPDNPFIKKYITNSIKLPNHIYRTGGVKTIKIWGNISYFGCKQVKDFINWGYPAIHLYWSIQPEDLLKVLRQQGIMIDKHVLTQAKVEGRDNFNKVETTFTGTTLGTILSDTFAYLTHFDMSNSPNIVDTGPYDPFRNFNNGRLRTFIADNCRSLQWTPDLHFLGSNNNSSKLTSISFKNCINLKHVRPIEIYHVFKGTIATTQGLDLTTGGAYGNGVFEGCLNIEEFDFGYDVLVRSIDFKPYTKLRKITGNLIMDGLIYHGQGQFYQFCKGLPLLDEIWQLTLKGSCFTEAFMDCPNLGQLCTTIVWGSSDGQASLKYMYSNIRIKTVNISKIYQNETDPNYLDCTGMFQLCSELTKVTNSLQVNQHVKSQWSFDSMFEGCSYLTTISPIFKDKTDLPSLNKMFKNCNIKTIPNDIFNSSYEGVENTPTEMFANNKYLNNYPVLNDLPMWKMPPFFFTGITWAHTFTGCNFIADKVPVQWGGILGVDPAKFKIKISEENYTLRYRNYTENGQSVITLKTDRLWPVTNGELTFSKPGIYTLEVYYTGQGDFWVTIPDNTTEILDWGNAVDIDYESFPDYPYSNPVLYFDVTKLPYGKNLFSKYGTFNGYLEGGQGGHSIWYKIKNITDVDDNILQNCGSVTKLGKDMWGGYSSFSMSLSEQKYTAMLSYLTNLSEVHRLFDWNNEVIATFTTTCGIFKNNPGLTNIEEAFADSKLQTIPADEFSNNKELVNVSKVFLNSTELTNMPNFLENKKITNFSQAFDGCSKLTGSTPTDENGYKLWQRAGKQGYPATINGEHCFRGCTQLDDYDEIPSNWK